MATSRQMICANPDCETTIFVAHVTIPPRINGEEAPPIVPPCPDCRQPGRVPIDFEAAKRASG